MSIYDLALGIAFVVVTYTSLWKFRNLENRIMEIERKEANADAGTCNTPTG
jgi:hypothetical protein